ncbi:MAG TPA: HIT family protein [Aquella sp.]|nr:HIT family protein [Aquella sp.]
MSEIIDCPLCKPENEDIIFTNELFRIIHVEDKFYPGYFRLILNRHVAEMTDIDEEDACKVLSALLIIERHIREILNPYKVNLASLGNMVPHLHWHIIPRYKNDRHFPNPIWGKITNPKYSVPDHLIVSEKKLINFLNKKQNFFQKI